MVIFIEDLPRMLPTKFWFIWPGGFRGEDFFRNQPIRNKNGLWRPCLLTDRDEMSNLYRGPSVDASYQVSVHLAKRFQRWRFKKYRPIRNKNCLWRACLLMDRDKMNNLYKGPSIDASYQVSVHSLRFASHAIESFLTW
jgi:predicted aminopeptidase